MTAQRAQRYWHGGFPGLKPGDLIVPATESGTTHNLTGYGSQPGYGAGHVRADRVHLTTERSSAKAFAAAYPNGALYQAEPVGEIEPDPDAPDEAIRCERARVIAVYDPCVRWAERGAGWLRPLMRRSS